MKLIKLHLKGNEGRFRLGAKGLDDVNNLIHSDLLFSALVNVHVLIYGEEGLEAFINAFRNSSIRISSCSYGVRILRGDTQTDILLFPKPLLNCLADKENLKKQKTYKKYKWVSFAVLRRILEGYVGDGNTDFDMEDKNIIKCLDGGVLIDEKELAFELPKFYFQNTATKVSLSRQNRGSIDGALYFQTDLVLRKQKRLNFEVHPFWFFLADVAPDFEKKFQTILRVLADEGIGGGRSTGSGQFGDIETSDLLDFSISSNYGLQYAFSLVLPEKQHCNPKSLKIYQLLKKGGMYFDQEKSYLSVNMIREGAILSKKVVGRMENIAPDDTRMSLKNGYCFGIPF